MKIAFIILSLIGGFSAFAQNGHPNGYPNGGYHQNYQEIEVMPGSVTTLTVGLPTVVRCTGTPATQDQTLRCSVEKITDTWGNVFFVIKQNGKELSAHAATMSAAIADLKTLRDAGICY